MIRKLKPHSIAYNLTTATNIKILGKFLYEPVCDNEQDLWRTEKSYEIIIAKFKKI